MAFTGNRFKYSEQELRDRWVGQDIQLDTDKFRTKKSTYTNEEVWNNYTLLRRSCQSLFKNENSFNDQMLAERVAQLIMDTFLIRRSRGENVKVPTEICSVSTAPDEEVPIEMLDAALWEGKPEVTENEKLRWVYENMQIAGLEPHMAPSSGAWFFLQEVRASDTQRKDFYKSMWPKLLAKEDADKGGRLKDSGKDTIELISRIQEAMGCK